MRISDGSSDVCSSDLLVGFGCREAVGVDDERARLALADEAAVLLRLPEGHPHRAGVALRRRRHPQHHHVDAAVGRPVVPRSEEHTSELQSLMRITYAVFCLQKKTTNRSLQMYSTAQQQILRHSKTHTSHTTNH